MKRCKWVNLNNKLYIDYHDHEWGKPFFDDNHLFEMLILEMFQAGLSWECILNKRKYFKEAFDNFDYNIISNYDNKKIEELLSDKNIIRNRIKIESAINNAKAFIKVREEYNTFSNYIWSFTDNKIIYNTDDNIKISSSLSDEITKDMKKRGFKFLGTKIIYSYLESIGIINDHELNCDFRE